MEKHEKFGTTMRIDLTPEAVARAGGQQSKSTATSKTRFVVPKRKRNTNNLPADKNSTQIIGGAAFQELLQNIYDAVLITSIDGTIVKANERAHRFFAAQSSLTGNNILSLLAGSDHSVLETIVETLENDRFVLIQAFCQRLDLSNFPSEVSVNYLRAASDTYLSFFIRDITVRRQTEEQLSTGFNAIQNAGSGIAVCDLNGIMHYCNPSCLKLLHFDNEEQIEGFNLLGLLLDQEAAAEITKAIRNNNHKWDGEIELQRTDQTTFYANASVAPNFTTDDEITGMVISIQDITESKRAQELIRQKNAEMEADLKMAREVQQAFLPSSFPRFPEKEEDGPSLLDFSQSYLPSGLVGGDFFDVIRFTSNIAAVVIADVMGHGTRAALIVATLRGFIEQLRPYCGDPGDLMTRLNILYSNIFHRNTDILFSSVFFMLINTDNGICLFTSGGHPAPLLIRDGQTAPIDLGEHGQHPAIGLIPESKYNCEKLQLKKGDRMLFYTDGITEAMNDDQEEFQEERMCAAANSKAQAPLNDMLTEVINSATVFSEGRGFDDDVCLLAMQYG